ncbi:MAG: exo-alpha-sialidase [Deltaproteobacteria bacterium]|nr:exo-alpha-sialidase [Deltaproteobacteria bacterium]
MNRRLVIILILATLILYAWPMTGWLSTLGLDPATFTSYAPPASADHSKPFMVEEFINADPEKEMVHVGSICQLSDGRLMASWYGGTREGAKDVAVFLAIKDSGHLARWSKPKRVVDRISASKELYRYIKKVGNPVIFAGSGDQLWLVYVTISAGGWSGSSLNVKMSSDAGATWNNSRRLTLSPFFNISELVRNKPLPLSNGGFALPIYHECLGYFPEILWIQSGREDGAISFRKSRMTGGQSFIQPSVVAYGPSLATSFYRCRSEEKAVGVAVTKDAGVSWSEPQTSNLPNPDAAVDAVLLSDHRILLAFNDSVQNRENLRLAVSNDGGANWVRIATLDSTQGQKYSYPYMIRSRDGLIHLVYTWHRRRIKHVVFNEAWINAQMKRIAK